MAFEKLIVHDVAASQRIARYGNKPIIHGAAWLVARTGDSIFWILLSVSLILLRRSPGWLLLSTVALTGFLTAVVKFIIKRERPSEKWTIATDIYSFPSGHATRAGAVAVALAFTYPQYAILCIIWAGLVSICRVLLARHYLTDVTGGLLFGILIGILIQAFLPYVF